MGSKITLQQLIEGLGAAKLAALLGVDAATVRYWRTFESAPRPETAAKIIDLSMGLVTWESIYQPYVDHKNEIN